MRISRALGGGIVAALAWAATQGHAAGVLPGQPLVQAPRVCATGVIAINHRCKVIDFAKLGVIDHRAWYYAFYATRWADRHGRMERGFPVFFYLQRPATLRLGLWVNDAPGLSGKWGRVAPPRPVLIPRPDGTYLGLSLKAVKGPDDQRLFKLNKLHWAYVEILRREPADLARIEAAVPDDCQTTHDELYDWAGFRLRTPLAGRDDGRACGVVISDIDIRENRVVILRSMLERPTPRPAPPLTPALADHTSPSR